MKSDISSPQPEFIEFKHVPSYHQWIAEPLNKDDLSLREVNSILQNTQLGKTDPYGHLIFRLSGHNIKNRNATKHWQQIILHKSDLEKKIGRQVKIKVAALDYFDTIGNEEEYLNKVYENGSGEESAYTGVYSHSFFQERLKEEFLRAKRYGHSLSLILLDVDAFRKVNEIHGFKMGDLVLSRIVKIIKRTIRTVDILSRFSGDQFMTILPNTNKREAQELAERIRKNVQERSKYMKEIPEGVTVTLAVIQLKGKESSSSELVQRTENLLEKGKAEKRNFVYIEE